MKLLDKAEITNFYGVYKGIVKHVDTNLYVKIPHYQRPYKWTNKQIEKLFEDYYRNSDMSGDSNYFVGSLVTVKADDQNFHDMIDGQQRVTTVFLLNYLKFLLLRVYTLEEISTRRIGKVDELMRKIENTYCPYIGNSKIDDIKILHSELSKKVDQKDETKQDDDAQRIIDEMVELYKNGMNISGIDFSNMEEYYELTKNGLEQFFLKDTLGMQYARGHYNEKLKEALCSICIQYSHTQEPYIYSVDIKDYSVKTYVDALKSEFDQINSKVKNLDGDKLNPREKCSMMIDIIDKVIESLKFCIISTCNYEDAYTLFEVLNDRALAIEDIDLIKNMLFRTYCQQSKDTEEQKDINIQKLDDLWGNDIFSNNIAISESKLIQLLGTCYLTGDTSIIFNEDSKFRKSIQNNYLSVQYPKGKEYAYINIHNDISVYLMVKILTEQVKLYYNNTYIPAIKAELSNDKSITYKTIHLLFALDMKGVLAGLVNQIIKEYICRYANDGNKLIDCNDFKNYVVRLIDDKGNNATEFENIHITAYSLWRCALLSKSADAPRKLSKECIENINSMTKNKEHINFCLTKEGVKEFIEWTDGWRYKQSKQKELKIRIFLLNLCKTSKDSINNQIEYGPGQLTFTDYDSIQLDHLEAHSLDENHPNEYFHPVDPLDDRNNYVDCLGNFMVLDGPDNNDKNNKPLYKALPYYQHLGNHWLIDEFTEMIMSDKYSKLISGIYVPKEEFFTERKRRLQQYFLTVVEHKINEKKVDIHKFI